jgi:hypothetical protein
MEATIAGLYDLGARIWRLPAGHRLTPRSARWVTAMDALADPGRVVGLGLKVVVAS